MKKNVVIITAKGSNESLENKNLISINGLPIMCYPLREALKAKESDLVYVSTEDNQIAQVAEKEGAMIIKRPENLATPESQHKDVIKHAVESLIKDGVDFENVIVLLGNTVMITSSLIDQAFKMLNNPDCDSIATVWKAQDDHPFRAMIKNEKGYMEAYSGEAESSNRQTYPDVFFYDQGIWAFKKDCALKMKGPKPWVWLGEKCKMIERPWVTGKDIHSWIDISACYWYLTSIQPHDNEIKYSLD